jgi:5,5'-dehydrodivanillate O-demethylase oxygenase subunit
MLRKRFLADLDAIDRGEDPKAVIRDPAANKSILLPVAERDILVGGLPFEQLRAHPQLGHELRSGYPFQAGQPEEVRKLYEQAMGL